MYCYSIINDHYHHYFPRDLHYDFIIIPEVPFIHLRDLYIPFMIKSKWNLFIDFYWLEFSFI